MAVLSKLLKYDLRANLKIFLFIWPAILVFGLLERVALMAELPSEISAIFVNLTTKAILTKRFAIVNTFLHNFYFIFLR